MYNDETARRHSSFTVLVSRSLHTAGRTLIRIGARLHARCLTTVVARKERHSLNCTLFQKTLFSVKQILCNVSFTCTGNALASAAGRLGADDVAKPTSYRFVVLAGDSAGIKPLTNSLLLLALAVFFVVLPNSAH